MENIWTLIAISTLVFVLGAAVGSFLNVVAFRLPKGEEIFKKRSYCPKCKTPLSPFELVPIVSYLFLHGKCRTCGKPISLQYPIVETVTGLLFAAGFVFWLGNFGFAPLFAGQGQQYLFLPQLAHFFFIVSILIVVFVIDLKDGIIPDSVVKTALVGSVFLVLISALTQFFNQFFNLKLDPTGFGEYLIEAGALKNLAVSLGWDFVFRLTAAVGVFLFFGLLVVLTRGRGMGLGDVKFGFWLGFIFSTPQIFLVIFSSFVVGAAVSIILIVANLKKFGQTVPFGPFLAIGSLISLFFGENLLSWYLNALT